MITLTKIKFIIPVSLSLDIRLLVFVVIVNFINIIKYEFIFLVFTSLTEKDKVFYLLNLQPSKN